MEPILNKAEIADLLKAIKEGRIPLDIDEKELNQFTLCSPLDLFNLEKLEREHARIPNFDIIIDTFCRLYATSLTNQLQRTFSINRVMLESFEFQKFMADKRQPGAIGIIDMAPLIPGALIIFDPKLSFSMLEIMLGASNELESPELSRNLTTIELNILKESITDACKDLDKAFSQLLELNTSLVKLENNARLVSIVEPESEVIVSTLNVKVGDYSGEIHLIFPFNTLEPLRDSLKELLNITTQAKSSWQDILEDEIMDVPVTLTAQSGVMTRTVKDVLSFKVGDIIELDYDPNSPLKVLVEDNFKFTAVSGTHNGSKAISLVGSAK